MDKIVKGMIQVAGTTYRVVRLKRREHNSVRVLAVGAFTSATHVEFRLNGIDPPFMREIACVAIQGAKTGWVGRALPG